MIGGGDLEQQRAGGLVVVRGRRKVGREARQEDPLSGVASAARNAVASLANAG